MTLEQELEKLMRIGRKEGLHEASNLIGKLLKDEMMSVIYETRKAYHNLLFENEELKKGYTK